MRILALTNQKGGVGKTTLAVHLAVGLGLMGHRTLLIDCDYQGSATHLMQIKPTAEDTLGAWLPWNHGEPVIYPTPYPNVEILPAYISMAMDEREAWERRADDKRDVTADLTAIANKIRTQYAPHYAWVILDAPPSIASVWSDVALLAAHRVLIPVIPGELPVLGLRQLMSWIESIRTRRSNTSLRVLGIVANMVEVRTLVGQSLADMMRTVVPPAMVFQTYIPKAIDIPTASIERVTGLEKSPKLMAIFKDLTMEVQTRWPNPNRL